MSLIYEILDLRKYYGSHLALDIPFFRLEQGKALVLAGANGCGKSTFLRILAFIEEPTSGNVRFLGNGEPRRECTLLLQEPWLAHDMVYRNVLLGLKLRGKRRNLEREFETAMQACGFANPWEFAKKTPAALSGGEKQRVALAARLAFQPSVLLLDEPTAYVDAKSAACIMHALRDARSRGTTIVCATHDPSLASALGADTIDLARPDPDTQIHSFVTKACFF